VSEQPSAALLSDLKIAGESPKSGYCISAVSYGLQAGMQSFGYAMFMMSDAAVEYLRNTKGFGLGTGPSIVVVDEGMASTMSTSTLTQDIYAYTFGQKGLMAGLGLQGTKISRITR
jgi:lipid-binding SYLF domain-containing protein